MDVTPFRMFALMLVAGLIAACSTGPSGIRVTKEGAVTSPGRAAPEKIRNFSSSEIRSAITGKTFQYTRSDGNGFVTYNGDGSFSYQDDVKGGGTGRWSIDGSQFCEAFGAGAPTDCGDFKSTGDAYFAAKSRLVEMKV